MSEPLEIGWGQLSIAASLQLLVGLLSVLLGLKLGKQLAIAATRMVAQLLLVGAILQYIFRINTAWAVAAIGLLMVGFAAQAALSRTKHRHGGLYFSSFAVLGLATGITLLVATRVVVRADPWWAPRYSIPILGMLLGNCLTGVSLCLDRLLKAFAEQYDGIEMELALGATRWEAAQPAIADAVRTSMIPTLNTMTVAGIVSLPGMMTGQILAGSPPGHAVRYQIMIFFAVAASTCLGCIGVALSAYYRYLTPEHRMRRR